jgi:mannan endo-1,4-beta-mannosidase
MKFSLFANVVLAASGLASFLLPSSSIDQPAPLYPIGSSNGTNAKVSGRLFDIDGKVGYFAGLFNSLWQMQ